MEKASEECYSSPLAVKLMMIMTMTDDNYTINFK
jgi:hypothetical protein